MVFLFYCSPLHLLTNQRITAGSELLWMVLDGTWHSGPACLKRENARKQIASIHFKHLETNVRYHKHAKLVPLNVNNVVVIEIKKAKVTGFLSMHTQIQHYTPYKVKINWQIHVEYIAWTVPIILLPSISNSKTKSLNTVA